MDLWKGAGKFVEVVSGEHENFKVGDGPHAGGGGLTREQGNLAQGRSRRDPADNLLSAARGRNADLGSAGPQDEDPAQQVTLGDHRFPRSESDWLKARPDQRQGSFVKAIEEGADASLLTVRSDRNGQCLQQLQDAAYWVATTSLTS